MVALRLSRAARPAVQLRRLLVAAAAGGTGFLLLSCLGYALNHPERADAAALRLSWSTVPLAATVYFALAVARTDPGTRPRPGLSAAGLGPGRLMALSALTTALSCTVGSLLALLVFLHLRGDLTGMPFDGAAAEFLAAGRHLPVPATLTLLALTPAVSSATVAVSLRPQDPRPTAPAPRRFGRFGAYRQAAHPERFGTYGRFGAGLGRGAARHGNTSVPTDAHPGQSRTAEPTTCDTPAGAAAGPLLTGRRAAGSTPDAHTDVTPPTPGKPAGPQTGGTPPTPGNPAGPQTGGTPPTGDATGPQTGGTPLPGNATGPQRNGTPPTGHAAAPEAVAPDADQADGARTAPADTPAGLPWGITCLATGLTAQAYAQQAQLVVLLGWLLTATGLVLAAPGLAHLCGRLLQSTRPGALRLLAGRVLMAEATRIGRPLGVLCAVASAGYTMTTLYAGSAPAFGPLTDLGALVVAGCTVATLLTAAVETRQCRADTTAALLRLGARPSMLRTAAALRAAALLAAFGPLTLLVAALAALPVAR